MVRHLRLCVFRGLSLQGVLPHECPTTSLLLTFGTFALTFLARPIGGVLLGTYADRCGRKASLLLSIAMMTIGTLAVGCMPTFDRIGVLTPLTQKVTSPSIG